MGTKFIIMKEFLKKLFGIERRRQIDALLDSVAEMDIELGELKREAAELYNSYRYITNQLLEQYDGLITLRLNLKAILENFKKENMEQSGSTLVEGERINQTVEAGIAKPYAYHRPGDDSLLKITKLRQKFSEVDALVKELCPASRERSETITCLETTAMWAIKSVVINDPKSEVSPNN